MSLYFMNQLHEFKYDVHGIEKYILSWTPSIPENRAHQVRIQTLKNLHLNEFHGRYLMDRSKFDQWKIEQLRNLVDWAFESTKFYNKKFKQVGYELGDIRSYSDFASLPCITRDEVISNFPEQIVSKSYDVNSCRWYFSSGSSGAPVQLVAAQERSEFDTLHRHRMFEIMAGTRFDKDRWIYNINHAHWWHASFNGDNPVFSISQRCPTELLIKHIARIKPVFISSITGAIINLAQSGVDLRKLGVLGVSTNSETSSRAQRDEWSKVLNVPVCDEYSSEEVGLMASECRFGHYHCIEDDTHIELINTDESGVGEVVGTDMWNYAMPIIKYKQGDLSSFSSQVTCECGSQFKQVKKIHGRIDEAFYTSEKKRVPASLMLDFAEEFLSTSGFSDYRVIQQSCKQIEVFYALENEEVLYKNNLEKFSQCIKKLFNSNISISFIMDDKFMNKKRFKRKIFVNNLKGN